VIRRDAAVAELQPELVAVLLAVAPRSAAQLDPLEAVERPAHSGRERLVGLQDEVEERPRFFPAGLSRLGLDRLGVGRTHRDEEPSMPDTRCGAGRHLLRRSDSGLFSRALAGTPAALEKGVVPTQAA